MHLHTAGTEMHRRVRCQLTLQACTSIPVSLFVYACSMLQAGTALSIVKMAFMSTVTAKRSKTGVLPVTAVCLGSLAHNTDCIVAVQKST